MPNFELTENLRHTIRDLRKKKKKRGDELSRELGKGASYISQIENGKIKEIDLELLDEIFRKITDLPEEQYNDYMNNLLDTLNSHMTDEELQHEKWMHQFNHEIRQYPITNSLIEFIRLKLNELNYTPEEFVGVINQNRGLEGITLSEANKLQIEIIDDGNGNYRIISSIRFELPEDFISKILSKEMTTINYINMEGILFNLFLSDGNNTEEAHMKTKTLLYENKFYTIRERNKLVKENIQQKTKSNESFTFYDVQPTDYDKEYAKLKEDIDDGFNFVRDKNIVYACDKLKKLSKNMHDDLGFIMAIMSVPLYKIDTKLKTDFWDKYQELVTSYIQKSSDKNE